MLHVNNPRWEGVPFVLKAGKALTDRKAEVRIQFHRVPGAVSALKECAANELVVRLQPEQTIYWKVRLPLSPRPVAHLPHSPPHIYALPPPSHPHRWISVSAHLARVALPPRR